VLSWNFEKQYGVINLKTKSRRRSRGLMTTERWKVMGEAVSS